MSNNRQRMPLHVRLEREAETEKKQRLRRAQLERQGGKCGKCGLWVDAPRVALVRTGPGDLSMNNTMTVHKGCVA